VKKPVVASTRLKPTVSKQSLPSMASRVAGVLAIPAYVPTKQLDLSGTAPLAQFSVAIRM
jgi:hypothetical protein